MMSRTATHITVVVPTHNPRLPVLQRVLQHLAAQSLPKALWNAIVVDNASNPPLDEAFCREHLAGTIIVRESRPGLLYARLAGIAAVTGDIVVFVDDDNLLEPTYLESVQSFMSEHPNVGVLAGRITGEFETEPPAWSRPHLGSLALRDLGAATLISNHRGRVTEYDYFAPYGAGMAIRSACCRDFATAVSAGAIDTVGRCGTHLGGCEDCELVMLVWRSGLECAYVPSLLVTHVIPASRLRLPYLSRLAREGQESWARFLRRHELTPAIPPWTVPLRQLKAVPKHKPWNRQGLISWLGACGFFAGAATDDSVRIPRKRIS